MREEVYQDADSFQPWWCQLCSVHACRPPVEAISQVIVDPEGLIESNQELGVLSLGVTTLLLHK